MKTLVDENFTYYSVCCSKGTSGRSLSPVTHADGDGWSYNWGGGGGGCGRVGGVAFPGGQLMTGNCPISGNHIDDDPISGITKLKGF